VVIWCLKRSHQTGRFTQESAIPRTMGPRVRLRFPRTSSLPMVRCSQFNIHDSPLATLHRPLATRFFVIRTEHPVRMRTLTGRRAPKDLSSCAKSCIIRTSATPLPQLLYNPHLQDPLGSADSKALTASKFPAQPLYFPHLRDLLGSAGNTGLITPV